MKFNFKDLLSNAQAVLPTTVQGRLVSLADAYHWLKAAACVGGLLEGEELSAAVADWSDRIQYMSREVVHDVKAPCVE